MKIGASDMKKAIEEIYKKLDSVTLLISIVEAFAARRAAFMI